MLTVSAPTDFDLFSRLKLTSLSLADCSFPGDSLVKIAHLSLTTLNLRGAWELEDNRYDAFGGHILNEDCFTALTDLDVSGYGGPPLPSLAQLRFLKMNNCLLSDLIPFDFMNLTHLDMGKCDGVSHVLMLRVAQLTQLTFLDVSFCEGEYQSFGNISKLTNLEHLNVEGIENLGSTVSISSLTRLTSLYIDDCDAFIKERGSFDHLMHISSGVETQKNRGKSER